MESEREDTCSHPPHLQVEDHHSGDFICTSCGIVLDERVMAAPAHTYTDDALSFVEDKRPTLAPSHSKMVTEVCQLLNLPSSSEVLRETAREYHLYARHLGLDPSTCSRLRRRTFLAYAFKRTIHQQGIYRLPTLVSGLFDVPHVSLLRAENTLCRHPEVQLQPIREPARLLMGSACRWLRFKPPFEEAMCELAESVEERFFGHAPETVVVASLRTVHSFLEPRGLSPIVLEEIFQLFQLRGEKPASHLKVPLTLVAEICGRHRLI